MGYNTFNMEDKHMKKRFLAGMVAGVVVVGTVCGVAFAGGSKGSNEGSQENQMEQTIEQDTPSTNVGGWTINDQEIKAALPSDVQAAFDKALTGYTGMNFEPVAYLGSQVVAGTNHRILCRSTTVTAQPVTAYKVVTVYEKLDGTAEITSVADFNLGDYAGNDETVASEAEENTDLTGGWTVYGDQAAVNLPADVQKAFDDAFEGWTGASYEPLVFLGQQVVSGSNYSILCRETIVTAQPITKLAVVTIYNDLNGHASVKNIADLNIADLG